MIRLKLFILLIFYSLMLQAQNGKKQRSELETNHDALNFIVMGDWGRKGEGHQKQVAAQMGKIAEKTSVDFIITTGDNFYPGGVVSEYDSLWKLSYEDIYTASSLQVDWYPVLGNHDYGSNPDAQKAYSKISNRWKMPGRYYSQTFSFNGDTTQQILFAFIDTSPLVPRYYLRGFHFQDTDSTAQKMWLENLLSTASSNVKWKIVVGHHPMYSGGTRKKTYDTKSIRGSLQPVFEKYKVDAYLTGHEHTLQHIGPIRKVHHFISGTASDRRGVRKLRISNYASSKFGFMLFTVTKDKMRVQVISHKGKVLYKTSVVK